MLQNQNFALNRKIMTFYFYKSAPKIYICTILLYCFCHTINTKRAFRKSGAGKPAVTTFIVDFFP